MRRGLCGVFVPIGFDAFGDSLFLSGSVETLFERLEDSVTQGWAFVIHASKD